MELIVFIKACFGCAIPTFVTEVLYCSATVPRYVMYNVVYLYAHYRRVLNKCSSLHIVNFHILVYISGGIFDATQWQRITIDRIRIPCTYQILIVASHLFLCSHRHALILFLQEAIGMKGSSKKEHSASLFAYWNIKRWYRLYLQVNLL